MIPNPEIYFQKSINQIPRILTHMDRNEFSPTYGCCHRDFWLYKTSDFPDAVRQFGIHALALLYKKKYKSNPYYKNEKIFEWALAGLKFWTSIQHSDGSFDEFYPNERGWVGPTAFTTFTSIETYKLLKEKISKKDSELIRNSIKKSAYFIMKGDAEEDHLANHHAMACLSVWKAYKLLGDERLYEGYKKLLNSFLNYHKKEEGWSLEYDGIDPGYLSATISFLGKIYQENQCPKILEICKSSIKMCSFFVYPNGYYAGSLGSRNTLHFYPHGFEIFRKECPLASKIADTMLMALSEDKLVPPSIMSDRYLFYRVPEFLQSFFDYPKLKKTSYVKLPYEENNLKIYFKQAKIWVMSDKKYYIIANLAKGGVLKIFKKDSNSLLLNDCGFIGQLETGEIITTQWIDNKHHSIDHKNGFSITGNFNEVPTNKYFNLTKNIIFRLTLLFIGWNPSLSHSLKGWIRRILMLGNRRVNLVFKRTIEVNNEEVLINDQITKGKLKTIINLSFGNEFFVRYVPQSRFFQEPEMHLNSNFLNSTNLNKLNKTLFWQNTRKIN